MQPDGQAHDHPRLTGLRRWHLGLGLLLITLLAFALRLPMLGAVPPGLYGDEAWNGVDALRLLDEGLFELIYTGNFGREGLMIWLQAGSMALLGRDAEGLRMAGAVIGALGVPALAFFARELALWHGHSRRFAGVLGLVAAGLLAVSFWHLNFSRIAFRAILDPFIFTLGCGLLLRAFRRTGWQELPEQARKWWQPKPRWRSARPALLMGALAGLVLGAGIYAYPAYRFLALPFAAMLLVRLWRGGATWRARWQRLTDDGVMTGALLAGLIIAAPMLLKWADNPDLLFARQSMAIWAKPDPWAEFLNSAGKLAGMYLGEGDMLWRHNYAYDPALYWPVQPFFVIGLCLCGAALLKREGRGLALMLIIWGLAAHLPAALTWGDPPHMLRALIAAPWAMVIAALPIAMVAQYLHGRWLALPLAGAALMVAVTGWLTSQRYFIDWPAQAGTQREFLTSQNRALATLMARAAQGERMLIIADVGDTEGLHWRWALQLPLFATHNATSAERSMDNPVLILPYTHPQLFTLPTAPAEIWHIDTLPDDLRERLQTQYPDAKLRPYPQW